MNLRIGKLLMFLCFVLFMFPCGLIVAQNNNAPPSPDESNKQTGTNREGQLRAGDYTRKLRVGDLERRYHVYVPKKYDSTKSTPVVLVYHGGGGNPAGMIRLTGMNAKADAAGFIVVYPGTVTTTAYSAVAGGAVTEFVIDAEGGHGWPGSRSRRDGNAPIKSFSGADRVWEFFRDKHR